MLSGSPLEAVPSGRDNFKKLRGWFITGLVALGPLMLTLWIVVKLFIFMDGVLGKPIRWFLARVIGIEFFQDLMIPGIGFVALITLILLTGWFARQVLGGRLVNLVNRSIERIPLINKVYVTILQISQALLGGQKEVFKHAVLIEYPRRGMWCIGFLTQDTRGAIQDTLKEDVISVFLPTTPNPTSGFLLFVPKKDVVLLDISVEESLKLVISGGAVIPVRSKVPREAAELMGIRTRRDQPAGGSAE